MSIRSTQKKRGRPATGQAPRYSIRLPDEVREAVEQWASAHPEKPVYSVAVRLILTEHLKAKGFLK